MTPRDLEKLGDELLTWADQWPPVAMPASLPADEETWWEALSDTEPQVRAAVDAAARALARGEPPSPLEPTARAFLQLRIQLAAHLANGEAQNEREQRATLIPKPVRQAGRAAVIDWLLQDAWQQIGQHIWIAIGYWTRVWEQANPPPMEPPEEDEFGSN